MTNISQSQAIQYSGIVLVSILATYNNIQHVHLAEVTRMLLCELLLLDLGLLILKLTVVIHSNELCVCV